VTRCRAAAPRSFRSLGYPRGWLIGDKDVAKKQRHTARRIWQRLVREQDA